ncbi:MAG: HAD family hydrolase [Deltaproteobacteria bacterium]|nr:HAD family hydrolase [Deltaproteobacteria bacterium]
MTARGALFLDRDGVITEEVDHLSHPDQVTLLPGAGDSIAVFNRSGIPVILVTNQSAIARGLMDEAMFWRIQDRLNDLLEACSAHLDGVYFCPHHPTAGTGRYTRVCACRKPAPGLILRAASELNILLEGSLMVGDKRTDLLAGEAAGCSVVLVRTGHGQIEYEEHTEEIARKSWPVFGSLAEARDYVLRKLRNLRPEM